MALAAGKPKKNEALANEQVSKQETGETNARKAPVGNGDDVSDSTYKDDFESSWGVSESAYNFDAASASYKSGHDYGASLRQRNATIV